MKTSLGNNSGLRFGGFFGVLPRTLWIFLSEACNSKWWEKQAHFSCLEMSNSGKLERKWMDSNAGSLVQSVDCHTTWALGGFTLIIKKMRFKIKYTWVQLQNLWCDFEHYCLPQYNEMNITVVILSCVLSQITIIKFLA